MDKLELALLCEHICAATSAPGGAADGCKPGMQWQCRRVKAAKDPCVKQNSWPRAARQERLEELDAAAEQAGDGGAAAEAVAEAERLRTRLAEAEGAAAAALARAAEVDARCAQHC